MYKKCCFSYKKKTTSDLFGTLETYFFMFQWDEASWKNPFGLNEKKYLVCNKIFGGQGDFRINLLALKTKFKWIYLTEWFKEN